MRPRGASHSVRPPRADGSVRPGGAPGPWNRPDGSLIGDRDFAQSQPLGGPHRPGDADGRDGRRVRPRRGDALPGAARVGVDAARRCADLAGGAAGLPPARAGRTGSAGPRDAAAREAVDRHVRGGGRRGAQPSRRPGAAGVDAAVAASLICADRWRVPGYDRRAALPGAARARTVQRSVARRAEPRPDADVHLAGAAGALLLRPLRQRTGPPAAVAADARLRLLHAGLRARGRCAGRLPGRRALPGIDHARAPDRVRHSRADGGAGARAFRASSRAPASTAACWD